MTKKKNEKRKSEFVTGFGQTLTQLHDADKCIGEHCPIHNPSPHAQSIGKQYWRDDRGFMERICVHGIGHPDPDAPFNRWGEPESIHGCCGCCQRLPE